MNKKENIRIIKKEDKEYPGLLKAISDPPKVLYCIGDVKLLSGRALGVVGSRKCSEYGRTTAMRIGETAARNDVTVVSGMAKGIDRFAHLGALGAGGKTIAVLGCGVNICFSPLFLLRYSSRPQPAGSPGRPPRPYCGGRTDKRTGRSS